MSELVITFPDGERRYPMPQSFTYREMGVIKRITGLRAGELEDALNAGDVDVIVALAVIAGTRAGDTVTPDDFEDLEFGAIAIADSEDDQDRPTEDVAGAAEAPTTSEVPGTPGY